MSGASDPREWVERARQDARSARRLLTDPPELGVAAYHIQQAVEKAAKAILAAEGIVYPRGRGAGHDLEILAGLIPAANTLLPQATALADLTPWATVFRYPADDPLTAEPLPARPVVEGRLAEAEAFVEAVAFQIASRPVQGASQ